MKNLILLAVQGAGKGTISKLLSDKYGYVHISTGDILRERAAVGDELGNQIKGLIDNGLFVPNQIIFEAIEHKITQKECENGYILDGFPRNIEQAYGYEQLLQKLGKDIGVVINLTLPIELLTKRIIGRRICKGCGSIYNIYNESLMPKQEGICDLCNGELYQRADDNEEAMKIRIDNYFVVTEPIINYYKEKNILYEIDSSDTNKSLTEIESILKSLGDSVD